jgi:hypothetical protein
MSTRLPDPEAVTRSTMSSVNPIQKLRWSASIRSLAGSVVTIVQSISFAVASANAKALSGPRVRNTGAMS